MSLVAAILKENALRGKLLTFLLFSQSSKVLHTVQEEERK